MEPFATYLKKRLKQPLPGLRAQRKMEPKPLEGGQPPRREPPSDAVASGVMLLFFSTPTDPYKIVLTVRSEEIEQGGQICLPGGRAENVESPTEAALRETHEEIGVKPNTIQVLGTLSTLYVNTSNSLIHPVVGYTSTQPNFRRDPYEVREIFTTSLDTLSKTASIAYTRWKLREQLFRVPYWNIHEEVPLWGATAMILAEFMELYGNFE